MRFTALALLSLAPTLALAQPQSPQPAPQAAPQNEAAQAQYAITLLEPGAEPRREIRYELEPDQSELMVMRIIADQSITADGVMSREMNLPAMVMEIDLQTREIAAGKGDRPEGTVDASFEIVGFRAEDRPESPAGLGAMLTQNLQGFTTVSGGLTLEPTGRLTELRLDRNAATPPAVQQSLAQTLNALRGAFAPFPDEAVGIGATWRLDMVIPFPQMTMSQRVEYTLSKIEGDIVTLDVKLQQAAPEGQEIEDLEGEWDSTVSEARGVGTGKVVIDLSRLAPISSDSETTSRVIVDSTQPTGKTAQTVVESKTRVETTGEVK